MPGRLGPRFALEAAFLVLLAVAAGLADLSRTAIVLVMAGAWLIVAVIEFTAERLGSAFPPLRRSYVTPPPVRRDPEAELAEATVVTPVAEANEHEPPAEEKDEEEEEGVEVVPAAAEEQPEPEPEPEAEPEGEPEPEAEVEPEPEAEPEGEPEPEPPRRRRFWRRREPEEAEESEIAEPPRHVRLLPRKTESSPAVEEVAEIFDRAENSGDDR